MLGDALGDTDGEMLGLVLGLADGAALGIDGEVVGLGVLQTPTLCGRIK